MNNCTITNYTVNPEVATSAEPLTFSAVFTSSDWEKNKRDEARTHLLVFPKKSELNNSSKAEVYIKWGESENIHQGYKCRIREEWQIIPSIRISEALFRMFGDDSFFVSSLTRKSLADFKNKTGNDFMEVIKQNFPTIYELKFK